MTISYLKYPLENGTVHNWLVVGPQATLVADLDRYTGPDYKLLIAQHYYESESGIGQPPAERRPVTLGDVETQWAYVRCHDDHFVDLSLFHHICHYLRAWAYTEIVSPAEQTVTCILTTNGPADLWLNGAHVHRQEHFYHQLPKRVSFELTLQPGPNKLLVRFEQVAARECPYAMAMQIVGATPADSLSVRLPTTISPVKRRQLLERAFTSAQIRQDVFRYDDEVTVHWPDDFRGSVGLTIRVQSPAADIYSEGQKTAGAGVQAIMGTAYQFPDGPYDLFLMPTPQEYYEGTMRIERKIRCWITRNRFSETPYGDIEERRYEALLDAAHRECQRLLRDRQDGAWARGSTWTSRWCAPPSTASIAAAIAAISTWSACWGCSTVSVKTPAFPPELIQPLRECILGFKYWNDEPGSDAMCYTTENHSILFHTCEVLAGQLFPDQIFANNGQTGQWHRETGERRALEWLRDRAANGFKEWDSNCYFEEDTLALSHLADLAEDDEVAEMAAVVLDKMMFTMAVNSFRGVFGSTHGRTYTPFIKSGYNEATSGISRLLWGMGVFNSHVLGTVSLACSDYELPPVIAEIAADLPEEMWSRERHAGELALWRNSGSHGVEVNKVTYKTPDYYALLRAGLASRRKGLSAAYLAGHARTGRARLRHPPDLRQ